MSGRGVDSKLPAQPASGAVRAALQRVLASEAFRAAPQLSAFLSFIVGRALEGRGSELKGYTIAVEAFGRPPDFDPQTDPIVRVEAGRLRRALGQYYAGEGRRETLRITMPVGGYVPVFDAVEIAEETEGEPTLDQAFAREAGGEPRSAPETAAREDLAASRRWPVLAAATVAIALAMLAGWYLFPGSWHSGQPAPDGAGGSFETTSVPQGPASPQPHPPVSPSPHTPPASNLAVLAIMIPELPSDPVIAGLLQRFSVLLVDALVRFDDQVSIRVMPVGAAAPPDADYIFEMMVQQLGDDAEGFGRLTSLSDGRIVWTDFAGRPIKGGIEASELAEKARRLATRLAEPFGIIHADSRQFATSPGRRCMISAIDLRRTMTVFDHVAARRCLQALVEQDPGFYPAWAYIAMLAVAEYSQGFELQSEAPLDRALAAALTAVRLAPSSARALHAMMEALYARGAIEDALKAGREALARNPYDPDVLAALGARYVQLDRPADGLPLLERAIASSAGHPSWYDFYAFLGAYLQGQGERADNHAAMFMAEETPAGLLGRAMRAAMIGESAVKEDLLARLGRIAPVFATDPLQYLQRRGFGPAVSQRILAKLGVQPRPN
ncbi:MAG: hypothetical protein DI527_03170 [Chelatococcus sp.]|nr:MAG: hypothetical protein DI527_03170 [Chelatococcus sp.]